MEHLETGELISTYRKQAGMTIDELVERSGVPKGTLNKIIGGTTKAPTLDNMKSIARALGKTLADFDDIPTHTENAPPLPDEALKVAKNYSELDNHGKRMVRVVISEEQLRMQELQNPEPEDNVIHIHWNDQPASAGEGFDLSDEHMEEWLVRYNELTRRADFCLNVQGHSMEPKFHDGDIALIRQQPAVDVGEIGLFIVDGKGYIKKQGPDRLISLNPDYDDVYSGEFSDTRCVGKVIGVLNPDWIVER